MDRRSLSRESIYTDSDKSTGTPSEIDTSDLNSDISDSEIQETMSTQSSAEAREADWSSTDNWENQESSSQVASQPFGATGGFRIGSEMPYGLQTKLTTVVAKSDDGDDDSTLKGSIESEPSTKAHII